MLILYSTPRKCENFKIEIAWTIFHRVNLSEAWHDERVLKAKMVKLREGEIGREAQ